MTGQRPPDPRPSRDRDLGFDELLAIFVALAAIGSILFWGLTRRSADFSLTDAKVFSSPKTIDASPLPRAVSPEASLAPTPRASTATVPPAIVESDRVRQTPVVPSVPERSTGVVVAPVPVPGTAASPSPEAPIVVAPPPVAAAVEFPDVPADYWAHPFIADLNQRGIIAGLDNGTFQPDQPVTRAQYASMIQGILPPEQRQQPIAFSDIGADYPAAAAIDAAVQAGFLKGYPDGTFQPDQPISHVQVLASLVNGIRLSQASPAAPDTLNVFSDANQIPQWAVPIVTTATQEGLVVNYPNPEQLQPNQPASRAEVAATVYQALEATGQVKPIQSRYIVQP